MGIFSSLLGTLFMDSSVIVCKMVTAHFYRRYSVTVCGHKLLVDTGEFLFQCALNCLTTCVMWYTRVFHFAFMIGRPQLLDLVCVVDNCSVFQFKYVLVALR